MTSHESPATEPSGLPSAARGGCDLSLNDWDEVIGDLERQLARVEDDDPTAGGSRHARWGRLYDGLIQLRDYYTCVPSETARHSADQIFLRQVRQVIARRISLIDDLMAALERV